MPGPPKDMHLCLRTPAGEKGRRQVLFLEFLEKDLRLEFGLSHSVLGTSVWDSPFLNRSQVLARKVGLLMLEALSRPSRAFC